ncbi:MAG: xylose isomerase, partial [Acidimicrobiaceae bacterium]|nr:xylose isomerase [Acidimicrobiaceae bacterium]
MAHAMLSDGALEDLRAARYGGWDSELGRSIMAGERSLADLHGVVAGG